MDAVEKTVSQAERSLSLNGRPQAVTVPWKEQQAMDVNEMLVFARVVQAGSFTAAAAKLGMPKSTVSRKVSELEERLKSRLLHRTTRKLSLTDAGRTYYDYCARIAAEVENAERAVSRLQETPRGLLRVTAPVNVEFLGPIVGDFLKRYPEIRLELLSGNYSADARSSDRASNARQSPRIDHPLDEPL